MFPKYIMEIMRLKNLRNVTTSVTVSDVHSVVKINTERMHTYLKDDLRKSKIRIYCHSPETEELGIGIRKLGIGLNMLKPDIHLKPFTYTTTTSSTRTTMTTTVPIVSTYFH